VQAEGLRQGLCFRWGSRELRSRLGCCVQVRSAGSHVVTGVEVEVVACGVSMQEEVLPSR